MPLDNLSYNSPSAPTAVDRMNSFKDADWYEDNGPDFEKLQQAQEWIEEAAKKISDLDLSTDDAKTFQDQFADLMEAASQELGGAMHLLENKRELL
ncbi:hypothetical protein [Sneathiella glossodoripedis]|uniref:hypothetical protein n=1 Tax=Sneathiella glossodoripedis TaxID=418853 RepID=UPI000471B2E4|nr:hypothetical protein [Sneathiella glossodoripedis]